jgi:hypothetical protein
MCFCHAFNCVDFVIEYDPPFPRTASLPATLTDEIKLYNPSAPISLFECIAPVTTIGTSVCTVKSKEYAVSSSVSVPHV